MLLGLVFISEVAIGVARMKFLESIVATGVARIKVLESILASGIAVTKQWLLVIVGPNYYDV